MADFNSKNNRAVWFDIPVSDLDRASDFYTAVLDISVQKEQFGDTSFCILEHSDGNGGCLVESKDEMCSDKGILLYLNVDNRIKDALSQVGKFGGQVVEDIHSISPYGYRAIVIDCEGNRIVLHSNSDA